MIKEKSLLNYCGLLGVAAFLSYTAAVVFSPLAYSGYDWMAQAVSDLSASNAPSLRLWNQLSSLYAKGVDGFVEIKPLKVGGDEFPADAGQLDYHCGINGHTGY